MNKLLLKYKLRGLSKRVTKASNHTISFGKFNRAVFNSKKEIVERGNFSRGDYLLRIVETQLHDQEIGVKKMMEGFNLLLALKPKLATTNQFVNRLWQKLEGLTATLEQYYHTLELQEYHAQGHHHNSEESFRKQLIDEELLLKKCAALSTVDQEVIAFLQERKKALQEATGAKQAMIAREAVAATLTSFALTMSSGLANQRGSASIADLVSITFGSAGFIGMMMGIGGIVSLSSSPSIALIFPLLVTGVSAIVLAASGMKNRISLPTFQSRRAARSKRDRLPASKYYR